MSNIDSITVPTTSLVEAAHEVCSVAREQRNETEGLRKLAPPIVEKLIASKIFRLGLPKSLGGWEDDPVKVLKTYEALSGAEASVAWISWNNHLATTFGRFLDEESMHEIYGNSSHVYANSTRPEGYAKKVTDGYMVSGRWTLVSGCELADWFALRCIVTTDDSKPKPGPGVELKILFIPKEAITIIDTWSVGGLRGTGSHDIEIEGTFVPERYAVDFNSHVSIDTPYSRLPIGCMNAAGCAAMALGLAKSATDELIKMGHARVTPGKNPDLRDRPGVQVVVAQSLSSLAASSSQLYGSVSNLWEESLKGNEFSDKLLADVWAAAHVAATTARSVVSEIYAVAGTSALYTKFPFERIHRDIHAVLQHGIIQPHWMNQAGMAYLGLTPTAAMFRI
jgi:alkylation response protein AidB-like acyl-CoA dehydrogenase